ncbi:uncharacterized protein MONOS_11514 [Monocercomonoides exilis]|uniref:uncharacterized protein n=1 Tax=Monocercomonoides exilis TaxID=2049356 RepID=UPI003559C92F|nr:hypothetical protein MONOS_11514 [Monocercomonoides exilis]|eukprot:MONOS_11514.1-p1 / transcript=MONOS_11514.1 / gene=MONOS_11514 / organism=Monocercomonoides_exilis_PA203 / gene_product=unspecified product / transcript_product=unspecified product / location=Mono_scaffold00582:15597-16211(+) / protein_length=205 / sequence_SO=supercontig / SO=protein_coding / is_pseudo=false
MRHASSTQTAEKPSFVGSPPNSTPLPQSPPPVQLEHIAQHQILHQRHFSFSRNRQSTFASLFSDQSTTEIGFAPSTRAFSFATSAFGSPVQYASPSPFQSPGQQTPLRRSASLSVFPSLTTSRSPSASFSRQSFGHSRNGSFSFRAGCRFNHRSFSSVSSHQPVCALTHEQNIIFFFKEPAAQVCRGGVTSYSRSNISSSVRSR